MCGTPSMKGITMRQNWILQDMLRSMMVESLCNMSLWGEAFKIAIYILNRVPTKGTIMTSYELWRGRKSTLKHLHI